jgi:hypothetical protein
VTLHERIAEALGWSLKDVQGFSLQSLRDIVPDPKLKALCSDAIRSGSYIFGLDADALTEPFCACGRVISRCDGSRKGCKK